MAKMLVIIDLHEVEETINDLRESGNSLDFIYDMVQDDLASGSYTLRIVPDPLPGMDILFECGMEVK